MNTFLVAVTCGAFWEIHRVISQFIEAETRFDMTEVVLVEGEQYALNKAEEQAFDSIRDDIELLSDSDEEDDND